MAFFGFFSKLSPGGGVTSNVPEEKSPAAGIAAPPVHIADRDWPKELLSAAEGLREISGNTEREFLDLVGGIRALSEQYEKNSSLSYTTANIVDGKGTLSFSELGELFERIFALTSFCTEAVKQGLSGLGRMGGEIKGIAELSDFLNGLSRSINTVGVLVRIEAARIEGAEFNSMTTVVDELASEIKKSTGDVEKAAADAFAGISTVMTGMAKKADGFSDELLRARSRVKNLLLMMDDVKNSSEGSCCRIEERSRRVVPEINEILSALQFHDICRQQMEHAASALQEISARMGAHGEDGAAMGNGTRRLIGDVIKIQISQLENVISETSHAARTIFGHLGEISTLADEQTEDVGAIFRADHGGTSAFSEIGGELDSLLKITSDCKVLTRAMFEALSDAGGKIALMSECAANIKIISENINLLAMNAIIKVARTGEGGRAMEVLANRISALSKAAAAMIEKGTGRIDAILEGSSKIGASLSGILGEQLDEADRLGQRTVEAARRISEVNGGLLNSMSLVSEGTDSLKKNITGLTAGITFHETIGSGLEAMISDFREMAAGLSDGGDEESTGDRDVLTGELEELVGRYTTDSERELHNAALAGVSAARLKNSPEKADIHMDGYGGGLGENVELF